LRIPFFKDIRITAHLPASQNDSAYFWWVIRGVENLPITIGGYPLPANAVLKLYKHHEVTLEPLEYLTLFNTTNNGAVWMITFAAKSGNHKFLEGCLRTYVGPTQQLFLLASGTEDYFQSAYGFDAGEYHFPEAGLTHLNWDNGTLSAYKVHDRDALFFHSGGFSIQWRNGDNTDPETGLKCVNKGDTNGDPTQSIVTIYAWVYEWEKGEKVELIGH